MASAPAGHTGYEQPPAYTPQPDPFAKQQPQGYQSGAPAGAYVGGPPGYQPVTGQPQQQYPYTGNQPHTVIVQPQTQVIAVVGGCPACRVGVLQDDFTCLGVCCAILFFPLGIICCLLMRQRRCPNCGAIFG